MSIKTRQTQAATEFDSLNVVDIRRASESRTDLIAEYLERTERLAPLFPRLHTVRARPLPTNIALAYETPQNLALELTKSILYENADSIDITALKSLKSHSEDSLWNGKPQQYFESMNFAENEGTVNYDVDSLAP